MFDFLMNKKEEENSAFKEQRSIPRWEISAKAKIKWDEVLGFVECEVKNLNMKGFSVIAAGKIPQECQQITVFFNENFFFTVDVRIVWSHELENKSVYGMQFVKIRDDDKEKIYQMMQTNFPEQFGNPL